MRGYTQMGPSWHWSQIARQATRRVGQAAKHCEPAFKRKRTRSRGPALHCVAAYAGFEFEDVWLMPLNSCSTLPCRRTVDYTGPYMRLIQERLRLPDRYGIRLLQPTAAGALKVMLEFD